MPRGIASKTRHYKTVYLPDHPKASPVGLVREHILVAEQALGRSLPPGVEVHHVNNDPQDCRNDNLVIRQDHKYHYLLHMRTRALRACGHADWRKCQFCKQYSPVTDRVMGKIRSNGQLDGQHHAHCRLAYEKAQRVRKITDRRQYETAGTSSCASE